MRPESDPQREAELTNTQVWFSDSLKFLQTKTQVITWHWGHRNAIRESDTTWPQSCWWHPHTTLPTDNESGTLSQMGMEKSIFHTKPQHAVFPTQHSDVLPSLNWHLEPNGRGRQEFLWQLLLLQGQNMQVKDLQDKILQGDATVVNSCS